jgi:hypothetical protein
MALVHVEITIDEEQLSERAARFQEKWEAKAYQYYCEASLFAFQASTRGGIYPVLARIYTFVDQCIKYLYTKYKEKKAEKKAELEEILPKHSILCQCGWHRCLGYTPSMKTYARKMKTAQ